MRHSGPAVILLVALIAACADSGTEPLPTDALARGATTVAGILEPGEYPEGVPPELQVPAIIHSLDLDVGWSSDGFAYAGAILKYTATGGYVEARVVTDVGASPLALDQDSQFLPLSSSLQTPLATVPMAKCQGTIRGEAMGKAWNEFVGGTSAIIWGEVKKSATDSYECPRSRTTTTTTPDSESGGDDETACYLVEIDHYWYYPGTGEVEYRYTEAYRYCDKGGDAYM